MKACLAPNHSNILYGRLLYGTDSTIDRSLYLLALNPVLYVYCMYNTRRRVVLLLLCRIDYQGERTCFFYRFAVGQLVFSPSPSQKSFAFVLALGAAVESGTTCVFGLSLLARFLQCRS